jgi:hypothetical protein
LKLRSRFALPPLDRSSVLPLVLAALLCAALAFQTLVGGAFDLPVAGPVRGGAPAGLAATRPSPMVVDPAIGARSMFTPILVPPKESAEAQTPLGSYAVVGAIRIGRAGYAIAQGPDGRTFRAGPGARIGAWQVRGVSQEEVRLARAGERMTVRFGPSGPVTTAAGNGSQ